MITPASVLTVEPKPGALNPMPTNAKCAASTRSMGPKNSCS